MADINVQAVEGATVYDHAGREIPQDRAVTVRKTMHILQAIRDGSLKEIAKKPAARAAAPKPEKKED